uniref:Uncharacterized protein n=1 Tax=Eptatretus burgeri TaxID=7764 RepID=A0A8C4WSN7_EPTBU
MSLGTFLRSNKVLIVIGLGLVGTHWGWYRLQTIPAFKNKENQGGISNVQQ